MSRIPEDLKSKYNHDNKFIWVDSQLEKFMEKQKELENEILRLEIENAELKDELENYSYPETDGYEVGSPSDYEIDPQLKLFKRKDVS